MSCLEQKVNVSFSYPVHFTEGFVEPGNALLADLVGGSSASEPKRMLVVVDQGVLDAHSDLIDDIQAYVRAHPQAISLCAPVLCVPGGEAVKNDAKWLEQVHDAIHAGKICRHSYVLGIGGGAVLDMVGFAAATAHRGVRHIRVPTTVLAQCDSGIGVKNGINAFGKKNFLGAFAPPFAVLNDNRFLRTLGDRDWRAGTAEAVKVALIKDAKFFERIEHDAERLSGRSMQAMERLVARCAELHLEHIATAGDPFELGSSRPLDFGHWAAHKLEQMSGYRLRHGEAVAIGIALDSTYSYLDGMLARSDWERILDTLEALGFLLFAPELLLQSAETTGKPLTVLQGLSEFREHLGGQLTIMLLSDIGHGVEVHAVSEALYREVVCLLEQRHEQRLAGTVQLPAAAPHRRASRVNY